jgi:hypothetical protein
MEDVKHLVKACCALALGMALCAAVSPELSQVQAIYILPMASGMDQYLANRLTQEGVLRVVTNPKQADAILTETLGPGFEEKMTELYPPPAAPEVVHVEAAPADKAEKAEKKGKADKAETPEQPEKRPAFGDFKGQDEPRDIFRPKTSSWSKGKGNFFLVRRESRAVIWSAFEKPRDTRPKSLNHTAGLVVGRLKKDLTQK